jgi:hypothetical protein
MAIDGQSKQNGQSQFDLTKQIGIIWLVSMARLANGMAIDGQSKQNVQSQFDVTKRTKKKCMAGSNGTTRKWLD